MDCFLVMRYIHWKAACAMSNRQERFWRQWKISRAHFCMIKLNFLVYPWNRAFNCTPASGSVLASMIRHRELGEMLVELQWGCTGGCVIKMLIPGIAGLSQWWSLTLFWYNSTPQSTQTLQLYPFLCKLKLLLYFGRIISKGKMCWLFSGISEQIGFFLLGVWGLLFIFFPFSLCILGLMSNWSHSEGPRLQQSPFHSMSVRTKRSLADHSGISISSKLKPLIWSIAGKEYKTVQFAMSSFHAWTRRCNFGFSELFPGYWLLWSLMPVTLLCY